MQRDINSNRSKKWIFRNSLKNQGCVNYVTELCYSYGIEKYCIDSFIGDEPALFIECTNSIMILTVNLDEMWLQSYKRTFKNSNDYYDIPTMHFEDDTCWKQGIEWVAKQERLVCAS